MPSPDVKASAGYIDSYGSVWLGDSVGAAIRLGREAAATKYLEAIASAVGGIAKIAPNQHPAVLGPSGRTVHISELLLVQDKWLAAIDEYISGLTDIAQLDSAAD
jgi:hypothetical protein